MKARGWKRKGGGTGNGKGKGKKGVWEGSWGMSSPGNELPSIQIFTVQISPGNH